MFLITTINTAAQSKMEPCEPYGGKRLPILYHPGQSKFKIKAVAGVDSATAREADYVEFKTMENIYAAVPQPSAQPLPPIVLFPKETPIYAIVTHRKHRHFPLVRGQLELKLEPLTNWNGEEIEIAIARHGPVKSPDEPKRRNDPCKKTEHPEKNCVAGRGNAAVAPIVPSVAGASAVTVAALAKKDETRFIAATAFFSIAKDVADVLNGTDVAVGAGEIFDLIVDSRTKTVCAAPPTPK